MTWKQLTERCKKHGICLLRLVVKPCEIFQILFKTELLRYEVFVHLHLIMPPTSKKLEGRIAFGSFIQLEKQ